MTGSLQDWRARPVTLVTRPWADYGLIDSGDGRRLERFGPYRFIRPEPQAMWRPAQAHWESQGAFIGGSEDKGGGRWQLEPGVPDAWPLSWPLSSAPASPGAAADEPVRFWASCTPFRHLAFFPDMAPQWEWMAGQLRAASEPRLLNLFGYSGVASLVAARLGAAVTHVDASKKAVAAARENQALSDLGDAPVRWIVDDARKFLGREARRGSRYTGVLIDPPKYGRGPKSEIWQLHEHLPALLADLPAVLPEAGPAFVIVTAYAVHLSALALGEALAAALSVSAMDGQGGQMQIGDMAIAEEEGRPGGPRLLPTAIYARWWRC